MTKFTAGTHETIDGPIRGFWIDEKRAAYIDGVVRLLESITGKAFNGFCAQQGTTLYGLRKRLAQRPTMVLDKASWFVYATGATR